MPNSNSPPWQSTACERCRGTVFATSRRDALASLVRASPELPSIILLAFHLLATALYHIIKLACARVTGFPLPRPNERPEILAANYKYPRSTSIAWLTVGVLGGWWLAPRPAAVVGAVLGGCLALRRLRQWRQWIKDFMGEVHRVVEMAILDDLLNDPCRLPRSTDGLRILDFGAGQGKTTQHIKEHHQGAIATVDAIDIEAHEPHVRKYDGVTIPLPPRSIDLAIVLYVLHHVDATKSMLRQIRQIARFCLIFEDLPAETTQPLLARLFFGCHFWAFKQPFHTHLDRSRAEWRCVFASVGFRVVAELPVPATSAIPYARVGFLLERADRE